MLKVGDRVKRTSGEIKGDVLKVSKDGSRIFVSFWSNGFVPKLIKVWDYAECWGI